MGYEVEAGTCLAGMVPKFDPEFEVFCALKNYGLSRVLVTLAPGATSGVPLAPDGVLHIRTPLFVPHALCVIGTERTGHVVIGVMAFRKEPGAPPLPDDADPVAMYKAHQAKGALLDGETLASSLPALNALAVATGTKTPADVVLRGGLGPADFGEFLAALRGLRAGGRLVVGEAS
jgi:hypothetical protein